MKPATERHQFEEIVSLTQDNEGYICTEDMVEVIDDRVFFRGRTGSVANIGGVKVQIEHVESVIRQHVGVLDCRVEGTPNPISGTVLSLRLVAKQSDTEPHAFCSEIRQWCRAYLPPEARPARMTVVAELNRNLSGKVSRQQ